MPESTPRSSGLRRWLVGGLTILILAAVLLGSYRWHSAREVPPPVDSGDVRGPVLAPHPVTLAPGIHLLGGLSPAAAYVVETSEGLVLIDAGLDSQARQVKQEMATLKLDWKRLRAIFLTHVHGDHCGGAEHLRKETGAKIYAGQGDAAILRAGRPREAFFSTYYMPDPTPGPTTVDVELRGDQVITLGDVRFTALDTPGHTPGSVCYLMQRGELRALFSGDVVWALTGDEATRGTQGWPLGTYAAYLAPRYRGDVAAFLSTLRRLRALPPPQLVLPGHPRNDRTPQSPAVSPERWQALLDEGIREMERLQARYAKDGAAFLDGIAKQLLPDLYYLGDFQDVAVYGIRSASKFYLVNAPGGPGLGKFVSDRFRELGHKSMDLAAVLLTSGDLEDRAGLPALVEKYHCQVVAPSAAREEIQKACPADTSIVSAEELPGKGWLEVQTLSLRGRGVGPVAYLVRWAGKTILFSGPIPIKPTHAAAQELFADFMRRREDARDYLASLRQLGEVKPDLWLPASPRGGQNANLYDNQWKDILTENHALFRFR
jgi:glyoxylase-like metal-dependent hydrolase (beta-lactamase superfamily II)